MNSQPADREGLVGRDKSEQYQGDSWSKRQLTLLNAQSHASVHWNDRYIFLDYSCNLALFCSRRAIKSHWKGEKQRNVGVVGWRGGVGYACAARLMAHGMAVRVFRAGYRPVVLAIGYKNRTWAGGRWASVHAGSLEAWGVARRLEWEA